MVMDQQGVVCPSGGSRTRSGGIVGDFQMVKPRLFICGKCKQTFKRVHNLQPVKVVSAWNPMCQYCWSELNWGTAWANKCKASQPEMEPVREQVQQ